MIWDDHQNRCIGELSFRSEVRAVKLRRDRVVVVLEYKIYVYNFADLKLVDHIETTSNKKGLCALCPYAGSNVLVCPGLQRGHVRVELYDQKKTTLIPAHEANLACFAVNIDGSRLATASERGTLIRIFDTATGTALQEVRRGADRAEIYCIAFNPTTEWLACSSDKGTVHIFKLKNPPKTKSKAALAASTGTGGAAAAASATASGEQKSGAAATTATTTAESKAAAKLVATEPETKTTATAAAATTTVATTTAADAKENNKSSKKKKKKPPANPKSSFSFMKSLLPKYFSSEWSFAQFRVPDVRSLVAFGSDKHSIVVVSADGMFYKATFDAEKSGSEAVQESFAKFLKK
jgi:WD40 repeat protein